jgi:hypothetical protein
MKREAIFQRVDATVRSPSSVAAAHDADGDLTPIGNEQLLHVAVIV